LTTIALVGFGRIGRVHLEAASRVPGVRIVAIADPIGASSEAPGPFWFTSADELLDATRPDAVLIGTPSATHARVARPIRARFDGRIVVEKPTATVLAEAYELLDLGVETIYHAAFAPEVSWAAARMADWRREHGAVVHLDCVFSDAYLYTPASLGNSWLDSGINALSVAARLVELGKRHPVREHWSKSFEALIDFDGGYPNEGAIATTWYANRPEKRTRLLFDDGAALALDHQAVTGRLLGPAHQIESFVSSDDPPRLVQHYMACFHRMFVEGQRCFDIDTERKLAALLLGA
jgi:predicted dehydrogenase